MERTEAEVREAIQALVAGDVDTEEFAEEFGPTRVHSFEETCVLSSDDGFSFNLPSGQRVFVTVYVEETT